MNKKIGIMVNEIVFPNLPVILKNAGYDFMLLDCEHGPFDFAAAAAYASVAKLCGLKMIVRIAQCLRKDITRYMDMGADGVFLAMTSDAAQIEEVVRYAKYAPVGKRGISTMRAHTMYAPPALAGYMREANEKTFVYAQIETAEGVKNARDIASVRGVDGLLFGPNDYACDIAAAGDGAAVCKAIVSVAESAAAAGKESGLISGVPEFVKTAAAAGMSVFSLASELGLLSAAVKENVRSAGELL